MTDLTLKELRFKHAQLDLKAEQLRAKQCGMVATSPAAAAIARQVREIQAQADNYAALIEKAEEMR